MRLGRSTIRFLRMPWLHTYQSKRLRTGSFRLYKRESFWIDVKYTGDEEGKVQYKLYIRDSGSYVQESNTEAKELKPAETHRISANMDDVIFDRETASVGMKIINSEDTDSVGDIGSIPITE